MITHIVLFKLADTSPESLETTAEVLRSMGGNIPELQSVEVGIDALKTERSFDLALVTRHADWDAYQAYQAHPVHQGVLVHMRAVVERSVAVDFET